jgi:hypothetical protein
MTDDITQPIAPETQYRGMLTDSRRWQAFVPRSGDVMVVTPPKSGTTWTQAILALLFAGDPNLTENSSANAPWFDNGLNDLDDTLAKLAAQTGRRQIKTHTPLDGVPIWNELRCITVYRHPIDVHFSARKHVANYSRDAADYLGVNFDDFPDDPRESFRIFLDNDDMDHGSLKTIVNHYVQCLAKQPRENILRLHYADMKRDLAGQVAKIANHIGISHPDDVMARLVEAATFGNMKANSDQFGLAAGKGLWRSDAGFFDSASSNKWEGVLTDDDLAIYDAAMSKLLNPEQRKWLEWGSA